MVYNKPAHPYKVKGCLHSVFKVFDFGSVPYRIHRKTAGHLPVHHHTCVEAWWWEQQWNQESEPHSRAARAPYSNLTFFCTLVTLQLHYIQEKKCSAVETSIKKSKIRLCLWELFHYTVFILNLHIKAQGSPSRLQRKKVNS